MARGGARPGSGRKPKDGALAALHGSRQRSVVRFPGAAAPPEVPAAPVTMPEGLPVKVAAVWAELAPRALAAGTLTDGTSIVFALFCRGVVLERKLAKGKSAGGANHRGMLQWLASRFKDFAIAPFGKALAKPVKVEDPFAEFDQKARG